MYTAIIVDDEPLVRKRIRFGFDWVQLGYEIIGEAQNGQEAIGLLRSLQPDLAVVDVMMPIMNGIELAAYVKAENIRTELVFLSAHSEFVYAQKAIHFGVKAYVLKPIDESMFIGILEDIRQNLDRQKDDSSQLEQMVQENKTAQVLLQSKQLTDCFCGTGDSGILSAFGLKPQSKTAVYALRLSESESDYARIIGLQSELEQMIAENYGAELPHVVFLDLQSNGLVCIMQFAAALEAHRFAEKLGERFGGKAGPIEHCGYSAEGALAEGYACAYEALNLTRYLGIALVAYETHAKNIGHYSIDAVLQREIVSAVATGNTEKLNQQIHHVFLELGAHYAPVQDLTATCQKLLHAIQSRSSGESLSGSLGEYRNLSSLLSSLWENEQLSAWFCAYAAEILQAYRSGHTNKQKYSNIAEQAKQIIKQEYMNSGFSLATVAERLNISASYFSSAFKAAEGISAVQYCSLVRLEQANALLQSSQMSIREIAEQCGFNDEYYFSKCYKKYYGYSPAMVRIKL